MHSIPNMLTLVTKLLTLSEDSAAVTQSITPVGIFTVNQDSDKWTQCTATFDRRTCVYKLTPQYNIINDN